MIILEDFNPHAIDVPAQEGTRSILRPAASNACSILPGKDIYKLILLVDKYQIAHSARMTREDCEYYRDLERAFELDEKDEHIEEMAANAK